MSRYQKSMREALQEVASDDEVFNEAVKWEVKISGLPLFYVDGKSRGSVRQALRKMLKRPDDIASIERTTSTELKKIRRGQAQGQEPGEANEEVEDAFDYKAKKGAIAAPGSGSIAKAKKAKAGDVNKSIEQQMKDALKEKMSVDDVVNAIQFGKPFKVVDEDIPAELPPGDPNFPRYKDIPNSVVDKEDKKANKVKDKVEKDTLIPTQTKESKMDELHGLIKQGKSADEIAKTLNLDTKTVKDLMPEQQYPEGGVTDDSGYTRYPSTGNWAGIKGKTYKKNLAKAQAKDKKDQNKDPVGKIRKENLEIWLEDSEWAQEKRKEKESSDRLLKIHQEREARYQRKKREAAAKKKVSEVAPPGWGHTKAEKEKTKPDKPKSKIGGSAHEFQKDLDSGKFKGLPGDKTYKDKKASMFKLMWSMKNKGDKPHYKPGVKDVKKAKYKNEDVAPSTLAFRARMKDRKAKVGRPKEPELLSKFLKRAKEGGYKVKSEENILDSAKRYLNEKADWNTAFKSAAQSRPPMKYKDAVSFIDTAGLNSTEKRSALKAAKKWLR